MNQLPPCPRCKGLMHHIDQSEEADGRMFIVPGISCVMCGNILHLKVPDPVVLVPEIQRTRWVRPLGIGLGRKKYTKKEGYGYPKVQCQKCHYEWYPRNANPVTCAKHECRTLIWKKRETIYQ